MSHARAALVCNPYLARRMVRRFTNVPTLLQFLVVADVDTREEIFAFIDRFKKEAAADEDDFEYALRMLGTPKEETPSWPKVFADVYEAILGAILIDSNFSLQPVWEFLKADV